MVITTAAPAVRWAGTCDSTYLTKLMTLLAKQGAGGMMH
ncbi:hypothetical protein SAMN04489740_1076 [Arthrobacter alpinus]|uniref:Uncharacterized protein n=1 Tax=Arthrobacter alpinus TaxID=656366 RepID=A0A1H5HQ37_9MICC|nr:hypothetical protein SAMN04489740_1076 [Arthrobacter alpinus]